MQAVVEFNFKLDLSKTKAFIQNIVESNSLLCFWNPRIDKVICYLLYELFHIIKSKNYSTFVVAVSVMPVCGRNVNLTVKNTVHCFNRNNGTFIELHDFL